MGAAGASVKPGSARADATDRMVADADVAVPAARHTPVPLGGLVAPEALPFPLFLHTADGVWVLYRPAGAPFDESHVGRLLAEGTTHLFVRDEDFGLYCRRVESSLDAVLRDRHMPLAQRADLLHGVAELVAADLLSAPTEPAVVARARRVMMATGNLVLREPRRVPLLRRVLVAGDGLAQHSLTVAFLSLALVRIVDRADAGAMALAGLAGLLHDVGRVDHAELEHDPEHAARGAELLRGLALPEPVVAAVAWHHRHVDGSGFADALGGDRVPLLARVVGLVDAFDRVRTRSTPRLSVFGALSSLAQSHRGCFEPRLAQALVRLFR